MEEQTKKKSPIAARNLDILATEDAPVLLKAVDRYKWFRNGLLVIFLLRQHIQTMFHRTYDLCTSQGCLDNEVYGHITAVSIFPDII